MVALVRQGVSLRAVARSCRVSLHTVQRWVARASDTRLDRVDWTDRPPLAHTIRRTGRDIEDLILTVRRELKERSALGEFGAEAIQRSLRTQSPTEIPTIRTIGRILARRGAIDYRRRVVVRRRRQAGTCVTWSTVEPNWIVSMSLRACDFPMAPISTC
jgi:hypothetical protein